MAQLRTGDIRDLMLGWDRAAFGIACRKMEVLLLHGENDKALGVFRDMCRMQTRVRPTMQSPLVDVLPIRWANMFEEVGYKNLAALNHAKDQELLVLSGCGQATINLVRQTVRAVSAGKPLPTTEDLRDLEPEWDLSSFQTKGDLIVSRVEEALQVLMESGSDAVVEIDSKISRLNTEIDNLKRMRKLLSPISTSKGTGRNSSGTRASGDYTEMAQRIVEVIKSNGPLKASAIAEALGTTNYTHIGRCVTASPHLLSRNGHGEVILASKA